jgi:hypothetical protein
MCQAKARGQGFTTRKGTAMSTARACGVVGGLRMRSGLRGWIRIPSAGFPALAITLHVVPTPALARRCSMPDQKMVSVEGGGAPPLMGILLEPEGHS